MVAVESSQPGTVETRKPSRTASSVTHRAIALCNMQATTSAVPAMRHFACRTAGQWGLPSEAIDVVSLVVTELVTNVVLHSGSKDVTVLISFDGPAATVEVKDAGKWRARRVPRLVAADADAAYGRGLELVRACTSWWLAFLSDEGTRVMVRVPVGA